jgi:hypothetical protein
LVNGICIEEEILMSTKSANILDPRFKKQIKDLFSKTYDELCETLSAAEGAVAGKVQEHSNKLSSKAKEIRVNDGSRVEILRPQPGDVVVFYIDVGKLSHPKAVEFILKVKNDLKLKELLPYNKSIFIPVSNGTSTTIKHTNHRELTMLISEAVADDKASSEIAWDV